MNCEKYCLTMIEPDHDPEVVNAALKGCCDEIWHNVKIWIMGNSYSVFIGTYKLIDLFGIMENKMIRQLKECFRGLDLHFYKEV